MRYCVIILIDGCITTKFTVDAESKEEAEELALDECYDVFLLPHIAMEVRELSNEQAD